MTSFMDLAPFVPQEEALIKHELLDLASSRSPLKWEIPEHAEPYYFPQLAPGI